MGYDAFHRGVALATVGLAATLSGTFLGGILTTILGLGHSLWLFGFLQIFSNLGYVLVAASPVNLPLMYGATGFESLTSGLGTGAFSVLLLRMTQKRFSATQYALLSSLFALPRLFSGPLAGFLVDAVGWRRFFLMTLGCGIPGMVLLGRFAPLGVREPTFTVEPPRRREPLTTAGLVARGVAGGALAAAGVAVVVAALDALKAMRLASGAGFDLGGALVAFLDPRAVTDWVRLVGIGAAGAVAGLFTAAVAAARHGSRVDLAPEES
jgi:PAT family beta-lactamase induction signal transducer AmpG